MEMHLRFEGLCELNIRSQLAQRLSEICDLGYAIVTSPQTEEQSDVFDNGFQTLTDTAAIPVDKALSWLASDIGILHSSDGIFKTKISSVPTACSCTLIGTYEGGLKLGILASHSKLVLSDVELRELTASAQMMIKHNQNGMVEENSITAKELVYLEQVANGVLDDDIADFLGLSVRAIKERKRKVIEDLGARNISHSVAIAKRSHLL